MNVSSLYIAQVKRKYGLDVGKAYNKPAKIRIMCRSVRWKRKC